MKAMLASVSPGLALSLAGLWLLLNQSVSPAHLSLGVLLGTTLAGFTSTLRPVRARLRRLDAALLLLVVVMKDVVSSNVSVAGIVLRSLFGQDVRSGFLDIPLDLRDPHGLAALAAILTATPGNVWSGLSPEGDSLTLHVLDLRDEAELIEWIKTRYERPLMRIFE